MTRGVEYVLLRPNEMDSDDGTQWTGIKFPGPKMNGIPRSDGRLVVKTSRITREVGLYDFTNPEKPIFLKHWKVSGNPDLAAFHNGKVIIPCGHQGVLMQK